MIAKKLPLTLDSDAFNAFKTDFNQMLRKLLLTMETQESEEGKLAVAMTVKLDKGHARDYQANGHDATRDIVTPTFSHKVSIALSFKDDKSGLLKGDYEMHWDKELGAYVIEEIDNGQTSFFDEDQSKGDQTEESEETEDEASDDEEPLGIPENATDEAIGVVNVDENSEELPEDPKEEQRLTFNDMKRHIDHDLKILESHGMYTVREKDTNAILLTSEGDGLTRIDRDLISEHMGHRIKCRCNDLDGNPTRISIWCLDCDQILWEIGAVEEVEEAPDTEQEGYEYEQPEE